MITNVGSNLKKRLEELERNAAAESKAPTTPLDGQKATVAVPISLLAPSLNMGYDTLQQQFVLPNPGAMSSLDSQTIPATDQSLLSQPQQGKSLEKSKRAAAAVYGARGNYNQANLPSESISNTEAVISKESPLGNLCDEQQMDADPSTDYLDLAMEGRGAVSSQTINLHPVLRWQNSGPSVPAKDVDWNTASLSDSCWSENAQVNSLDIDGFLHYSPAATGSTNAEEQTEISSGTSQTSAASTAKRTDAVIDRLENALESVRGSGFLRPDLLTSEYYTINLSASPKLASARRLDRNRGLPLLLSKLRESSSSWTEWEA